MTTQKDKIRARLKKSYYSDLMVLAASGATQGTFSGEHFERT